VTRDRAAALVLIALAGGAYWAASAYPAGTLAQPGAGFVPRLLAALLAVAAAAILAQSARRVASAPLVVTDLPITLLIVVLLGAATFALERLGYRITLAGLLFVFLAIVERRPLWLSALLSLGFALGSFYVINDVLRVPLPMSRWGW
jgi:Tripartite tricarboxylate transporter TctB family